MAEPLAVPEDDAGLRRQLLRGAGERAGADDGSQLAAVILGPGERLLPRPRRGGAAGDAA